VQTVTAQGPPECVVGLASLGRFPRTVPETRQNIYSALKRPKKGRRARTTCRPLFMQTGRKALCTKLCTTVPAFCG
jgi:hypothetical protein